MADKILIVDDMSDNVEAFKSVIETFMPESELRTADNGLTALEMVAQEAPDLVLLDVHMPDLDGFEVCRRLKTDPRTETIPVLMVSAFMTKGHHRALGLDTGADGYLCKPFDTAELIAQVRCLLRLKHNEDVLRAQREALETELEDRTRALRTSEEYWRNLFEHSPDAIFIEDDKGTVLEANSAACALHGMTHDELIGSNVLDLVPPDQRKQVQDSFSGWLDETLHADEGFSYTKSGEVIPVEVRAQKLELRDQQAVLLHVRDISERVRMERQLIQAQKLESVGILAGGIAHDFNNILTGVLGNISFAKLDTPEDAAAYESICEAEKAAFRARFLTQQLLTFSKGGAPVRKVESVAELLKDTANFVLSGSSATCQCDIDEALWPAEIDAGQISQVMENIVINASQAMPESGTIRLMARNIELGETSEEGCPGLAPGRYLKISVQDQGLGIDPDVLPRIFDPYFTTKKGGSGLGLATSYAIIKKHDGAISVDSKVNRGSLFTVCIPASDKPLPDLPKTGDRPIPGEGRILVMDDEQVILNIIEAALIRLGYTSKCVPDGQTAVEAYREAMEKGEPFDAVILDITVPGGMGGEETVGLLMAMDSDVKAIVSSGYATGGVMSNPERKGFKAVIAKPYSIQQLSVVLHEVLQPTS
ncbi:MAG: response regulator [Verrucomicrobia bacterium]|jgi:two-component system, cell cycle sensor histidine kinase and response regulator CckA|nr:response regulator [Verrucomicrobiota bacterium]